ncbi:RNA polymerase sigma-70 factor [Mangrovibacterium lignilyticum]|uniref:RNA polymerase sigma-70 factor n=1 Tax=Mangrovibacterium lignilyticum TaxID=2668052 RepID=UPI0013D646A9|nr:RNA polymerase sigma-70 factor [Mangrovibacterium lignilyticum]
MPLTKQVNEDDNTRWKDFQKGNDRLFDYFFDKYYQGLCVYAYKILNSHDKAEDVVQEFFVKIWDKRESLMISSSVKSYFIRSVHNICLDHIARQDSRDSYKSYQLTHTSIQDLVDYPLLDFELEQLLNKTIDSLPDKIKETFILSRIDGLTYPQIAEQQGISVKTVEYRIGKALLILRTELSDYLPAALLFYLFR